MLTKYLFPSLSLPFLTLAMPATINTTPLAPRAALPGSCPGTNYPTESMFTQGYTQFCTNTLPTSQTTQLLKGKPIVYTLELTNADKSISHWVYKISVESDSPSSPHNYINVDADMCKKQFQMFLDTDEAGGLGGAYCVVDGTGGDKVGNQGMSGEGMVSVLGGKTVIKDQGQLRLSRLEFASYRRRGGGGGGTQETTQGGNNCGAPFC